MFHRLILIFLWTIVGCTYDYSVIGYKTEYEEKEVKIRLTLRQKDKRNDLSFIFIK